MSKDDKCYWCKQGNKAKLTPETGIYHHVLRENDGQSCFNEYVPCHNQPITPLKKQDLKKAKELEANLSSISSRLNFLRKKIGKASSVKELEDIKNDVKNLGIDD